MSEDELCFVCGKEPLHEDGQCPACLLFGGLRGVGYQALSLRPALAELRKVVADLRFQNRMLNFTLQHEPDTGKRMEAVARHLTWMDGLLDAAEKI